MSDTEAVERHHRKLHVGSTVVAQFTVDGKQHKYVGFVRGHDPSGDPDKLAVDIIATPDDPDNLLTDPITKHRILQHGDAGEHATFRLVGEDG